MHRTSKNSVRFYAFQECLLNQYISSASDKNELVRVRKDVFGDGVNMKSISSRRSISEFNIYQLLHVQLLPTCWTQHFRGWLLKKDLRVGGVLSLPERLQQKHSAIASTKSNSYSEYQCILFGNVVSTVTLVDLCWDSMFLLIGGHWLVSTGWVCVVSYWLVHLLIVEIFRM